MAGLANSSDNCSKGEQEARTGMAQMRRGEQVRISGGSSNCSQADMREIRRSQSAQERVHCRKIALQHCILSDTGGDRGGLDGIEDAMGLQRSEEGGQALFPSSRPRVLDAVCKGTARRQPGVTHPGVAVVEHDRGTPIGMRADVLDVGQVSTRRGQPGREAALTGPPTAALTAYLRGYLPWGGEGGDYKDAPPAAHGSRAAAGGEDGAYL